MMPIWSIKASGVIHQEFDGEVVVIDLASGSYFSLAGSGGALWRQLGSGGATADALAAMLVSLHEVDAAQAKADVAAFLADLAREGLVVRSDGGPQSDDAPRDAASSAGAGAGAARSPYVAPKVNAFHDLQELFLLDPVHDVDPSEGWPHAGAAAGARDAAAADGSAAARAPSQTALQVSGADLVWSSTDGTAVVVNRDRGTYCRLDGNAARAWRAIASGPALVEDRTLADALVEGGFAHSAAARAPAAAGGSGAMAAGGSVSLHTELVEQIQPWGKRKRPPRVPASSSTRGLCDRLDAWYESSVTGSRTSEHLIARHRIAVETPTGCDCAALAAALPCAEGTHGARTGLRPEGDSMPHDRRSLLIRAWRGDWSHAAPMLANLVQSLHARWGTLCGPRGEVIDLHTDTTSAIFDPGTSVLSVIDRERNRSWFVKTDDRPFPFWEIGSPFRFLLHDHFAHHGMQFVHGAAVGDAAGALLVVGMGGSGKSSTAMACAAAGMSYLGDDYCIVDCESHEVHCLYRSGKLVGEKDLARLPAFAGRSINADSFERGGSGKGVYLVDSVVEGSIAASRPVAGIAVPHIVRETGSRVGPACAGDALEALMPSSIGQLPGAGAEDARRLERLVAECRTIRIDVGSDARGVAEAVRGALRACSASA